VRVYIVNYNKGLLSWTA